VQEGGGCASDDQRLGNWMLRLELCEQTDSSWLCKQSKKIDMEKNVWKILNIRSLKMFMTFHPDVLSSIPTWPRLLRSQPEVLGLPVRLTKARLCVLPKLLDVKGIDCKKPEGLPAVFRI